MVMAMVDFMQWSAFVERSSTTKSFWSSKTRIEISFRGSELKTKREETTITTTSYHKTHMKTIRRINKNGNHWCKKWTSSSVLILCDTQHNYYSILCLCVVLLLAVSVNYCLVRKFNINPTYAQLTCKKEDGTNEQVIATKPWKFTIRNLLE